MKIGETVYTVEHCVNYFGVPCWKEVSHRVISSDEEMVCVAKSVGEVLFFTKERIFSYEEAIKEIEKRGKEGELIET